MPRWSAVLPLALAAAAALGGCKKEKEPGGEVGQRGPAAAPQSQAELDAPIARIDDVVITVREFQERINRQSPYIRARYNSVEQKKEFLDALIRYEILAREAYRRGLDKDPDAVRAMKTVMIQKLMKTEFEGAVRPEDIPESELKAYYEANPQEWNKPEEVRVSAIVLDGKARADSVAKAALGPEGNSNKGFRDLVARWSTDEESKLRGGDLRYFARGASEVPAPVIEAAFRLEKTGDVAGPIDAGGGKYYIIKQTGRRRPIAKSFDQVKRQIQNTLWKDRRVAAQQGFVSGLRQKSKVEVFDSNLKRVRVSAAGEGDTDGHGHGHGGAFDVPGLLPEPTSPGSGAPPSGTPSAEQP
jgi:peptidyl-prolyl cis-trans isomerase C